MPDLKKYTVHRAMQGDGRDYARGDVREMREADAVDLVESGALAPEGEEPKVRSPAVQHTFGTAEATGHIGMTPATTDEAMAARPARAKAAPAA